MSSDESRVKLVSCHQTFTALPMPMNNVLPPINQHDADTGENALISKSWKCGSWGDFQGQLLDVLDEACGDWRAPSSSEAWRG